MRVMEPQEEAFSPHWGVREQVSEVRLVDDDHVVKQLSTNRSSPALVEGVLPA